MEDSIIKQMARTKHKKPSVFRFAFVFVLAVSSFAAQAGKITSLPSASGADGFAGWNLDNVEVVLNGIQGVIGDTNSWYDESNGDYNFAAVSDHTYKAYVDDTGIALAKDWPAGEPAGIKVINENELDLLSND